MRKQWLVYVAPRVFFVVSFAFNADELRDELRPRFKCKSPGFDCSTTATVELEDMAAEDWGEAALVHGLPQSLRHSHRRKSIICTLWRELGPGPHRSGDIATMLEALAG